MNILIRCGPVAGQDLTQRTPRGPRRSQSKQATRVTGDYDAGHIFHYHPLRRGSRTQATGWLLILYRLSLFITFGLQHAELGCCADRCTKAYTHELITLWVLQNSESQLTSCSWSSLFFLYRFISRGEFGTPGSDRLCWIATIYIWM